jgi:hypothetical protein
MPALDIFRNDAFGVTSLTEAILHTPFQPRRIGELRLFGEKGINTTSVIVEEKDGLLSLIPTSPRGGVADTIGTNKRNARSFVVPHLAREGAVYADEVQNVRAFGSETELQAVQTIVNDKLATLRAMHEVTLEHLRIGAIKGVIYDSNGSTVIYNLFTEFGVSQQTQAMALTTGTTDVRAKCTAIARQIEAALGAATYTGLRGFCGAGFFDALVGHDLVKLTFQYQEGDVLRRDLRKGFVFGGITWEEYVGSVGGVAFIGADDAYVFPEGVITEKGPLFTTHFAPADFMETVNTIGLPIYAKQAPDPSGFNRFVQLHSQSNPLPLCLIPRAVVKATKV